MNKNPLTKKEIGDLRTQRELLKEEIFKLSKPRRGKPQPRKKRYYKPRNKK